MRRSYWVDKVKEMTNDLRQTYVAIPSGSTATRTPMPEPPPLINDGWLRDAARTTHLGNSAPLERVVCQREDSRCDADTEVNISI
jgi:hypothetical protein